jgi:Tfp pilus assembly protein PilW
VAKKVKVIMRNEQGFSVVEMLMAAAITLVILGGTMSTFNSSLMLNERLSGMGDLEQNIRAGMNLVVSDFISAGWLIPIGGLPVPYGSGASAVLRPSPSGLPTRSFATKIDAITPGAGLGPTLNGQATDIVNILYADNELRLDQHSLTAIGANGVSITVAGTIQISGENVLNPIKVGDLIALSNSNGSAVQYVTGVNGQTIQFATGTADLPKLNQPAAASGSVLKLQNSDGTFPVGSTTAKRVWLVTYHLDIATDSARPRMMRQINYETPQAVALILEGFQLTYDIVNLSSNPTNVESPGTPSQIRKANILLTGRSAWPDRDSGEYLRKSLTTQVSLRSLSFFNRY